MWRRGDSHVPGPVVMAHAFAELRYGIVARQHENGFKCGYISGFRSDPLYVHTKTTVYTNGSRGAAHARRRGPPPASCKVGTGIVGSVDAGLDAPPRAQRKAAYTLGRL